MFLIQGYVAICRTACIQTSIQSADNLRRLVILLRHVPVKTKSVRQIKMAVVNIMTTKLGQNKSGVELKNNEQTLMQNTMVKVINKTLILRFT